MSKKILKNGAAAAAIALSAGAASADCGEITMTEMNWASSQVVSGVAKFVLEQGYGCTVEMIPSSTVPALASVAETGEPDIVTELWINGAPSYEKLEAEGKITTLTDVLSDGGVEGWWVPKFVVDEHPEAGTLEGILANPELVGNRFHQCPEGWGCQRANDSKTKAFGVVDAGIEVFQHGSGETLASAIAAAFENKEPWFGYYWGPTAILGKYPMVKIDLGEYNAEVHACDSDPECPDRGVGKSEYPVSPVKTIVTTAFLESHPEEAAFMKNLSFTNAQMNGILAWKEANTASTEEATVNFLTTRPDVWGAWINDAAKEKLSGLLQ
ncbi:ABC transporter substrate-binding protein [Thalassovita sp.]|uniref:ABC transporter substrate-binding protein n=1 Tax=Thalassovita sp. TaxID=1979401 RepID=UPI002B27B659|nr:ABC transporter substrate-binding protein [Thalassovita sp.]